LRCRKQLGERTKAVGVLDISDEFERDVGSGSVIPGIHHERDGHFGLVHAVSFNGTGYLADTPRELVPVQGCQGVSQQSRMRTAIFAQSRSWPWSREGVPGDTSPGLASQQLALSIAEPTAPAPAAVKAGVAAEGKP
jgi:hypothetical protein